MFISKPGRMVFGALLLVVSYLYLKPMLVYGDNLFEANGGNATILTPTKLGGATGQGDARDAEVYPSIAFDATTQRYLVVWLSARNAGSSSDGLDVYGRFFNSSGQPLAVEFRISDSNSAARSSAPTVTAGSGFFVVLWNARGNQCRVVGQRVGDTSIRPDWTLISGTRHIHSPSLAYHPVRQLFLVTYVDGDDYLPPTLFGAQTADCGNNSSSNSQVKAAEFRLNDNTPEITQTITVSNAASGAFRPRISFQSTSNRYLIAWEDRREASGRPYWFDVYVQRLNGDTSLAGSNTKITPGSDYTNYGASGSWTPRPSIASSNGHFLVSWFDRRTDVDAIIWYVTGRLILSDGILKSPFIVTNVTYGSDHADSPPSGFLSSSFNSSAQEYLVAVTYNMETIRGYISPTVIQRVVIDGQFNEQLLALDGSILTQPGVGYAIDNDSDDQIGVSIAVNPDSGSNTTQYFVAYGKHAPQQHSQDFDIWGTRIQISTGDRTPPTGDFIEPAPEARVPAPVWLRATAQDAGSGIARLRFTSNGTGAWRLITEDLVAPFEVQWDMAGIPDNQRFMIGIEIFDRAGNVASRTRWITKSGNDSTPPTGDFTEPAPEARVPAPVWLRVQAQDNAGGSGVARVRFTSNGTGEWRLIAEDANPPYETQWDMAGVPSDRRFMIGIEIFDRAGNHSAKVRWIIKQGNSSSCSPGSNGIVLYEHPSYGGRCITLTGDSPDFNALGFNDTASAIRFVGTYATGWAVLLYEHTYYSGESDVFYATDGDFGNNPIGHDHASSIRIRRFSDPDDGRTLSSGQPNQGTINPADDEDVYYFEATQGQRVTIRMDRTVGNLDSYLILYGPHGNVVAYNDDGGGNLNSLIDRVLLQNSGRYLVVGRSFAHSSTGNYSIVLTLPVALDDNDLLPLPSVDTN